MFYIPSNKHSAPKLFNCLKFWFLRFIVLKKIIYFFCRDSDMLFVMLREKKKTQKTWYTFYVSTSNKQKLKNATLHVTISFIVLCVCCWFRCCCCLCFCSFFCYSFQNKDIFLMVFHVSKKSSFQTFSTAYCVCMCSWTDYLSLFRVNVLYELSSYFLFMFYASFFFWLNAHQ